ncbi:hypothetical protein DFJ74DRAFT_694197 [Hyaloraphidium curvatum]|nr:hypothetical protein DFJ74DRAFT_694197 [Hyaloraphidium curvatum]
MREPRYQSKGRRRKEAQGREHGAPGVRPCEPRKRDVLRVGFEKRKRKGDHSRGEEALHSPDRESSTWDVPQAQLACTGTERIGRAVGNEHARRLRRARLQPSRHQRVVRAVQHCVLVRRRSAAHFAAVLALAFVAPISIKLLRESLLKQTAANVRHDVCQGDKRLCHQGGDQMPLRKDAPGDDVGSQRDGHEHRDAEQHACNPVRGPEAPRRPLQRELHGDPSPQCR